MNIVAIVVVAVSVAVVSFAIDGWAGTIISLVSAATAIAIFNAWCASDRKRRSADVNTRLERIESHLDKIMQLNSNVIAENRMLWSGVIVLINQIKSLDIIPSWMPDTAHFDEDIGSG